MFKACGSSDDQAYIVAFASRKFTATESKWNFVEMEAHSIIFATEKFRHYLLCKPFLLRTDNRDIILTEKMQPNWFQTIEFGIATFRVITLRRTHSISK